MLTGKGWKVLWHLRIGVFLDCGDASWGAERLTSVILDRMKEYIPQRTMSEGKSTLPWVNKRVASLLKKKEAAEGSIHAEVCRKRCTEGILAEYGKYIEK